MHVFLTGPFMQLPCPQLSTCCDPNMGPWRRVGASVVSPPFHLSSSFLFRQSVSRGPADPNPDRLLGISSSTEKLHDPPLLPPSDVCQSRTRRERGGGGSCRGRGEMGIVGQGPPGFESVKRELVEEKGFSEWGPRICVSRLKGNRQSCSSPVSMATISGPTLVLIEVFCFSGGSD